MIKVGIGSKVRVELYLGRIVIDKGGGSYTRNVKYEKHLGPMGGCFEYIIDPHYKTTQNIWHIHPDSFIGRALMNREVGSEIDANIGGLPINEMPSGRASGNHLRYKIISID